jgi:hypothetical protein
MNATKFLLGAAVLAATACGVDERSSIWIEGRPMGSGAPACEYAPGDAFQLGNGVLDVGPEYAGFLRYQLPLVIRNDLQDPVGTGQSESGSTFIVENVRVRVNPGAYVSEYRPNPPLLDFNAVGGLPARASVPHSGPPVDSAGGESATVIEAIPADLGFVIQSAVVAADQAAGVAGLHRIVLGVSIEGRTNDGRELEIDEYFYPIDVCQGCLPRPTCVAPQVEIAGSCGFPGQDASPVCGAATATP